MKLITRQSQANSAAERWRRQYPAGQCSADREEIYRQLCLLGAAPDPDEVDRIIGNPSWTETGTCDECGKEGGDRVEVGEEQDYESRTACLCRECVHRAKELLP